MLVCCCYQKLRQFENLPKTTFFRFGLIIIKGAINLCLNSIHIFLELPQYLLNDTSIAVAIMIKIARNVLFFDLMATTCQ